MRDSLPEQFALVTFNQSVTRITSTIYMDENILRVLLLNSGLATNQVDKRIQAARRDSVQGQVLLDDGKCQKSPA